MRKQVKKYGNSLCVTIDRDDKLSYGLKEGDLVEVELKKVIDDGKKPKAIILAAGSSTRLKPLTDDRPKCMLEINGKTMLQHQIDAFREAGITDISVVRGYQAKTINIPGVKYYYNCDFEKNNQLASLFYAENEMNDDFIVAFSDVLFDSGIARNMADCKADFAMAVETDWKETYKTRTDHPIEFTDAVLYKHDRIIRADLRHKKLTETANGDFIGLAKFSRNGAKILLESKSQIKDVSKAYLIDGFQHLIDKGYDVKPVLVNGGWTEIDSLNDFKLAGGVIPSNMKISDVKKKAECNAPEDGFSLGIGATGRCNFNCKHCYSKRFRNVDLNMDDLRLIIEGKKVKSVNFGTGENILNPQFLEMVDYLYKKGIKMSITSNGYSLIKMSEADLRKFNDVDISLDFPDQKSHDNFRSGNASTLVSMAMEKCRKNNVEFSMATAVMNVNYKQLPELLKIAGREGCNLRTNIFKPVGNITEFELSYDEFWDAIKLLFENGRLISCSEPIVNAMLGIPTIEGSPCGKTSLRIHPDRNIAPCVYWDTTDLSIDQIKDSFEAKEKSNEFKIIRTIPEFCKSCKNMSVCHGGCAARRLLTNGLHNPDKYCPIFNGKEEEFREKFRGININWSESTKDLVHASYLCTLIFEGKKENKG